MAIKKVKLSNGRTTDWDPEIETLAALRRTMGLMGLTIEEDANREIIGQDAEFFNEEEAPGDK